MTSAGVGGATVKLATWNIGGGVLGASHQKNREPSLGHHVSILRGHAPDVVCLQEAHDYGGRREGQAEHLARHAGYRHVVSFPVSASHLEEDAQLALAILSRYPLRGAEFKRFPNPGLTATGPDGDLWTLHDKGYLVASVDMGGRRLGIVNAHCFPLRRFGAGPTEERFARMWEMLANDLMAIRAAGPALAAMDLNHEPIQDVLMEVLRPGGYLSAWQSTATTAKGAQQDYILYDQAVRLLTTTVTATGSDHAYCQARFLM